MKRFAPLILTAMIACLGALTQAAAQEAPVTAQPAGEPVPFSETPNLLYVTELMQRAGVYARSIAEMSEVPDVEVRQVSTLPQTEASPEAFEDTINRFMSYYGDDIAALRSAMEGNSVVAEALQAAGVETDDVLAAEIRPDLALRVYIRD